MKTLRLAMGVIVAGIIAQSATAAAPGSEAVFTDMSYHGRDPVDDAIAQGAQHYRNPILPGFHPDPSIVRVGRDYYLVNSTFGFFPGLPIYHSRDLVNWRQIGNAIDRPSQANFTGIGINRGLFAPTLRWHKGVFYIANTCIDCKFNFIITATIPAGPWSDPIWLNPVDGIDPDIFFDDDGRIWISNNGPPVGTPRYDGHRALWIQEYDPKAKAMIGPRRVIVDGGTRPASNPIWTEGPHIIKQRGYYYLIAAEGGTSGDHSQTVYRSRSVTGPYLPGPINPILTQRDLDPKRAFPITATGHADFVQLPGGAWWAVFLGNRPYEGWLTNLGRETFMLPVDWRGEWPIILPQGKAVPHVAQRPALPPSAKAADRNTWRAAFTGKRLGPEWLMLRTPGTDWASLSITPGALTLTAQTETISGSGNPAFIGQRQQHAHAVIETTMIYTPQRLGDRAGLVAFADEAHHYFVGLWQTASGPQIRVARRDGKADPEDGTIIAALPYLGPAGVPLRLRITARGAKIDFAYARQGANWEPIISDADGRVLATEHNGLLFTGTVIGAYAARGP
jgi:xylan 1,4-beta-xylosidase